MYANSTTPVLLVNNILRAVMFKSLNGDIGKDVKCTVLKSVCH